MKFLSALFGKLTAWALAHKVWATVIALVILSVGWFAYAHLTAKSATTAAVTGTVEKGTIVATVSGTGQVSAENEVAVTPKASGDILSVNVAAGDTVHAGEVLATIDPGTTAFELQSAKLAYQDALSQDAQTGADTTTTLQNATDDARAKLASAASGFSGTLASLNTLLSANSYLTKQRYGLGATGNDYYIEANKEVQKAEDSAKQFQTAEASVTGATDAAGLLSALDSAYGAAGDVASAAKAVQDAVVFFRDREAGTETSASSAYTSATSAATSAAGDVSDIASARTTLQNAQKDAADRAAGGNQSSVRSAQLSLEEKQQAYDDTFVVAPFDGVVAKVSAKAGDQAGSAAIATVVTTDELVSITLNEVDVAKVKQGQKATVSFDAIDGLTLAGTVASVDGIGTVSSGVVSYGVTVALDTQDARVKPGMTANADIQTEVAQDALTVPASAVHTTNGESYVLTLPSATADANDATQTSVTTGITDGTNVQILSGLSEGQAIVVRQASAATKSTAASATTRTGFGAVGGGAVRTGGGNATFGR